MRRHIALLGRTAPPLRSQCVRLPNAGRLCSMNESEQDEFSLPDLLGRIVNIVLKDGKREISGKVYCVDGSSNVVLSDAIERTPTRYEPAWQERQLSLVVIPGGVIDQVYLLRKSSRSSDDDDHV